ncbi:hypothetical protein IV38_GL000317 [Lactobacillus selangorensis]|uniref:RibT protein n=1 Tax=Lactobacillus selangorensis TaxID=81857 RepID=A0A0R2G3C4_9LACO|nr:hypothetical protein [Lactobacillus selangorensis]KRN29433.1 hypothetical protein IV38_GL000317 [Lactobacillus selangorensis]KRN34038.1 hypothetical protein IV40_GL000351 [Lactobacillus selangorensis]
MLVKYKNDYQKIAMGFLSYLPDLKEISHLQAELKLYQDDETHCLYLWKDDQNNFTGIVGVEEGNDFVLVRHLSFSPSERSETALNQVLDALQAAYPDKKIMGSLETTPLITRWEKARRSPEE